VSPSQDLFKTINILEKVFCKFHGATIDMESNPIERLEESMKSSYPNIAEEVIELFVKIRFHHRIKVLNQRIKNAMHYGRTKKQRQFMF
jgi:hypothetical protein